MNTELSGANAEALFRGVLEQAEQRWAVTVSAASRLTLRVSFEAPPPPNGTVFDNLTLSLKSGEVRLMQARLEAGGVLVFVNDLYDCAVLLRDGKVVNLKSFLQKVPLVLRQKDDVSPEFKQYVADVHFGLSVYKQFYDEQDRIYRDELPIVRATAQRVLLAAEEHDFNQYLDSEMARLDALVEPLDREAYERSGTYLRRVMWQYIVGSEFLKRTNLRPRGYAGDAEMMRMIYEHRYLGRYVFNQLLHRHPISTAAAQAVRNRRALIPAEMRATLTKLAPAATPARFFSVACGPAWELSDVYQSKEDIARWNGTLLDQDLDALNEAKTLASTLAHTLGAPLSIEYIGDSVRTMLRTPDLAARFGRFHFIYSMGLFDYLTPPVARAVLAKLYGLLEPGGTLLVGNYHVAQPTRHYMALWMDWVLYLRTEEEFAELADGLGARISLSFDDTRAQMFLRLERDQ